MIPLLSLILELRIERSNASIYDDLMRELNEMERRQGTVWVRLLDPDTSTFGDLKLFATSQLSLNTCMELLHHKYPEVVLAGEPQVIYLQTIRQEVVHYGRYCPDTGGSALFAGVRIKLTPLPRGNGIEYINALPPPADWYTPEEVERFALSVLEVEKAMQSILQDEEVIGYQATDLRVTLLEVAWHPVDSRPPAHTRAIQYALRSALQKASPLLLEPIMEAQIVGIVYQSPFDIEALLDIPGQYRGLDLLHADRSETKGSIRLRLPLAELLKLEKALASLGERVRQPLHVISALSHYAPLQLLE